jgi:DNA-binding Lrp family transcriptional regulator
MRTSGEIDEICKQALEEYLNTPETQRSLTKLGSKYNIKRQTLSERFKKWGYEIVNQQNRCRLNEKAFDNIDSEEQFYWLGFIYADGNISHEGNRIEVRLSIKDKDHLEKFKNFLNLTTEIRTGICNGNGNGFCHLSVRNKHMWKTLNRLGCTPRKSLTLQFPSLSLFKRKENILHFIRGYVDGDGCLTTYLNHPKTSIRTELSLVGTESFLKSVNKLFKNVGYIKNKSSENWDNEAYNLSFSDVPSRKIARYLYENATIYLNRKYEKFLEFCRIEEESSKRQSSKIGEPCDGNTEVNSEITQGSESL